MRRTRTAKNLARRIDLDYFKRRHPLRWWRAVLSVAAPVVGLAWLAGAAMGGSEAPYSSGPLSAAHAAFGDQCQACHVPAEGAFRRHVTDESCLACHDGPIHHAGQAFVPGCASCHLEHRGPIRLARTPDRACAACHANLETIDGPPAVHASIRNFVRDHPEFAPVRSGASDPTGLKFNHEAHLRPDLRGPDGPVHLRCADCHRPEPSDEPWRFAAAGLQGGGGREAELRPAVAGRSPRVRRDGPMAPIAYERQCAACHPLFFDERIAAPAPHDTPAIVQAFARERMREYIAAHPEALRAPEPVRRLPSLRAPPPPAPRTADAWVAVRMAEVEQLLWRRVCQECHTMRAGQGPLPEVEETRITARWLPLAQFDHGPHRMMACEGCHAGATRSVAAADVLLPGIATCRECHQPAGAESGCFACHVYHDWALELR